MAAPTPFSRLQLAAALLEYDNDPDKPDAPQVNAKESAIFVNLRRPAPPPRVLQHQQYADDDEDDEDVPLSHAVQTQNADYRKSMVVSLVNVEQEEPDPEREEEDEMLSSWGLDGLVEKKEEKKDKRPSHLNLDKLANFALDESREPPSRALSAMLPNPHGPPTPTDVNTSPIQRYPPKRPLSMGDMDGLVIGVSPERRRKSPEVIDYRRSMIGTLDFASSAPKSPGEAEGSQEPLAFPAKDTPKSTPAEGSPNPFTIPLPDSIRRSRFDPKALSQERRLSIGSMGQSADQADQVEQEEPPKDSSTNFLGSDLPDTRARTHSMGTIPTQAMLDADEPSPLPSPAAPESKRLTRLDLLRPKVLVMPGPLQDQKVGPSRKTRDGFFTTDDGGFPLPPGSRTEARPGLAPLAGSAGNPRLSMSLSQLTFRQSLMVGGQRDPSYVDIERNLRTAAQDGEQADQGWSEEEDEDKELRPAGKLYGKSLIDNLEARKAVIKGKQRVFTGDHRPAMMQRPGATRSSTLIDPSTLNSRPTTQYLTPSQVQDDIRRQRASGAPLVDFSSEAPPGPNARPGMPGARSVFGVDKVWERELAKLKAIEEQEKEEQAQLKALDARLDDRRQQPVLPRSNSSNAGQRASALLPEPESTPPLDDANNDNEVRPPMGNRRESSASLGARGWFNSPGPDDESDGGDKRASMASTATMRPPAFSRKISAVSRLPQIPGGGGDSEEEDVPLAQQAARRSMMPRRQNVPADSDSDEDKPIAVLKRHQSKSSAGPSGLQAVDLASRGSFAVELGLGASAFSPQKRAAAAKAGDDSSEDEVPLGVRHPTANRLSAMPAGDDEDEDDRPLGAKFASSSVNPLQQQQMQQQAFLQQQMLQQQMMMQAQAMRTSMAFGGPMMNPSVMGTGFFPPPMSMHSLNANAMAVAQDAQSAQISRVDQWRRDVVQ